MQFAYNTLRHSVQDGLRTRGLSMPAQQGVATDIWHPSVDLIGPGRVVTHTIYVMPMYSMAPLRSKQTVVGFFCV